MTLSEDVRLNMQLFHKDAWVMNRLRSAKLEQSRLTSFSHIILQAPAKFYSCCGGREHNITKKSKTFWCLHKTASDVEEYYVCMFNALLLINLIHSTYKKNIFHTFRFSVELI